ncbi:hypothetical protein EU244_030570 [Rhodococcus qingshengii]|uniref:hypothetical protein n=1 Tax=Rhodococcus qingshengii TaxID=334542 RepID=UPI001455F632
MNGAQLTLFDIELCDVVAFREWSERMICGRSSVGVPSTVPVDFPAYRRGRPAES